MAKQVTLTFPVPDRIYQKAEQMAEIEERPITDVLREHIEWVFRRVVPEELLSWFPNHSILNDWSQEGPENPVEDQLLLAEALAIREKYKDQPEAWMDWEDFEAELDRAEVVGEL